MLDDGPRELRTDKHDGNCVRPQEITQRRRVTASAQFPSANLINEDDVSVLDPVPQRSLGEREAGRAHEEPPHGLPGWVRTREGYVLSGRHVENVVAHGLAEFDNAGGENAADGHAGIAETLC